MPTIRVEQGSKHGGLPSLAPDNSRTQKLKPPNKNTDIMPDLGGATMMTPAPSMPQAPPFLQPPPPIPGPIASTASGTTPSQAGIPAPMFQTNVPNYPNPNIPQELELELELEDKPLTHTPPSRFISSPGFRVPPGVSVHIPERPKHNRYTQEAEGETQTTNSPFKNPISPLSTPVRRPQKAFETAEMPPSYVDALQRLQDTASSPSSEALQLPTEEDATDTTPPPPGRQALQRPYNYMFDGDDDDDDDDEDTVVASRAQRQAQLNRSHPPSSPSLPQSPAANHTMDKGPAGRRNEVIVDDEESTFVAGPKNRPDRKANTPPPSGKKRASDTAPSALTPRATTPDHTLAKGNPLLDGLEDEDDEGPTRQLSPEQAEEARSGKAFALDFHNPDVLDILKKPTNLSEEEDDGDTVKGRPFVPPAPSMAQTQEPASHTPSSQDNKENRLVDRLIGQKFGNFRIDEKIGFGGFGNIYRATQLFLQQPIAVKVLHIDLQENDEVLARFRREAQALAQLRHDNIVQLSDFGLLPGLGFYIAMEYLEGESIHNRLKAEEDFPLSRIRFVTEELCRVLGYVHQKGVIHRDMKPSNIILYEDDVRGERLKLIDFGIAAIQSGASQITKVGSNLGTVRYMSPEQIMGASNLDGRSDLYSVATILFRLLTGQMPFTATNDPMLLHQKTKEQARKLTEVREDKRWAPELVDFFVAALAKNPADRPDDASHFWSKIEIALSAQAQIGTKQTGFDLVQAFSAPPPPSAAMPVDLGPAFPDPEIDDEDPRLQTEPSSLERGTKDTTAHPMPALNIDSMDEDPFNPTVTTPSIDGMQVYPENIEPSRKSSGWIFFVLFILLAGLVLGGGVWWYLNYMR